LINTTSQLLDSIKKSIENFDLKRNRDKIEILYNFEQINVITQCEMSTKLKDPVMFSITCILGRDNIFSKDTFYDLGALMNILPYYIYRRLGKGYVDMRSTNSLLQPVSRSSTKYMGILKDAIVKARKLVTPTNFMILDIKENNVTRPFISTTDAIIDAKFWAYKVWGPKINFIYFM